MSLVYKSQAIGKGGISAKVVADSVSPEGQRITTFELEYPRFIHSEFMTHRLFSRNAASSRAIPVKKILERIMEQPAMPIHWGKNQPGMSAREECQNEVLLGFFELKEEAKYSPLTVATTSKSAWSYAANFVSLIAEAFDTAGYHKQIVNRLTEPFQFIKVVCTATEYDNFFALRCHKDAQPEIQELASCMHKALQESVPFELSSGEWHLPYVPTVRRFDGKILYLGREYGLGSNEFLTLEQAIKVSASCCAQVSYRALDTSIEKALKIYDALVSSKPVHASPFEHQATPMVKTSWPQYCDPTTWLDVEEEGVTHADREGNYWSGNFKSWIQNRQLIPDHTVW
jgi:hypothetical protein